MDVLPKPHPPCDLNFRYDCEGLLYQDGCATRAPYSLQALNVSMDTNFLYQSGRASRAPSALQSFENKRNKCIYKYIWRCCQSPIRPTSFQRDIMISCIRADVLPEPHPPCDLFLDPVSGLTCRSLKNTSSSSNS